MMKALVLGIDNVVAGIPELFFHSLPFFMHCSGYVIPKCIKCIIFNSNLFCQYSQFASQVHCFWYLPQYVIWIRNLLFGFLYGTTDCKLRFCNLLTVKDICPHVYS